VTVSSVEEIQEIQRRVQARESAATALAAADSDDYGDRQVRAGWIESEVAARVNVYYSTFVQLRDRSTSDVRSRARDFWLANLGPEYAAACKVLRDRGTTVNARDE
jgi:hypothetical protein